MVLARSLAAIGTAFAARARLDSGLASIAAEPPARRGADEVGGREAPFHGAADSAPDPGEGRARGFLRRPGMAAWLARRSRRFVAVALVVALGLAVAGGVIAFFVAGATSGSYGAAQAGTLNAGNTPGTPTVSGRNLTVSWAQNAPAFLGGQLLGANANGGYLIERYAVSGGGAIAPGASCSGLRQGASAPLSCTESSVPTGRWQYTVTPKYYSWLGAESPKSASATIAPANPTSVSLLNGGGAGSVFVNTSNASSLNFDVSLPSTSLSSDTITLTLTDPGSVHTVTATQSGTSGAGTVHFTGVDASTLDDGTITITAKATSSYGDNSAGSASLTRTKDTAGPSNSLTLVSQSPAGSAFRSGTTIYYRGTGGGSGGSFRIQNAVSDAASGPASSATAALGGSTSGWTHNPSTVSTPSGGPYVSNAFSWTEGASSSPTEVVTGADAAGNTTATAALAFTNDSTAPTGGALTVNGQVATAGGSTGYDNTGSFSITRTDYDTDAGSGVGSSVLTREAAALTSTGLPDGTCGTYGTPTTITGTPTQSLAGGNCYRYRLTGTDNVGNSTSIVTIVKVDTSAPAAPSLSVSGATGNTFLSGTTAYINAQAGKSGSFQVTATTSDAQSGILKVNFPTPSGFSSGGGDDASSPFSSGTYNWSGAVAASGSQTVTSTNNALLTSTSSFTVTPDTADPTGGAVTVNGQAASAGGTTSYYGAPATISYTIGRTDYTDSGSGIASSTLTRESATLSSSDSIVDGTCGAFGGSTPITGNPTQSASTGITTGNCYRYRLTGTDNVGNSTSIVTIVKVDTSAPAAPSLSVSGATGNTFLSGTTAYINAQAGKSGSFQVTATTSDAQSGILKVNFPTPSGFSSGGGDDASSPFSSGTYNWSGAVAASGSQTVTSTNNALLTSTSSFTVTPDTADPTGGAVTVNGQAASAGGTTSYSTTTSFAISGRANYADAGSGLASSILTVQSETFANNTCGAPGSGGPFTSETTISGSTQPSGITGGFCYLYKLTGTDNVGNTATISTTVKVDTVLPTGSVTTPTNGATVGGTVTVTSNSADTGGSGVASAQFQVRPTSGSYSSLGAAVTGSPFQTSWDTTGVANGSYDLRVITTDNAGNQVTSSAVTVTVSNSFTMSAPSPQTAGNSFSVTITKRSAGVTDTNYTGSHTIVFSGPSNAPSGQAPTYPASVTFSNGVGTASVTLFNAETTTLTATEGNTTATSSNIVVNAAAAAGLTFTNATNKNGSVTITCTGTVGTSGFSCTNSNASSGNSRFASAKIALIDQYQNITTNTTGGAISVSLSSTGGTGQPSPTTLTIANGATTSGGSFTQNMPNGGGAATITATASIPGSVSAKWSAT
jgi:Bacterial Ig domain